MDKIGIKESLELFAAIELLAISGIDIAKDGFDMSDISKVLELVKKSDVIISGVKDIDMLDDEVKDLDQAELMQLGVVAFAMIKKIIAEVKAAKVEA